MQFSEFAGCVFGFVSCHKTSYVPRTAKSTDSMRLQRTKGKCNLRWWKTRRPDTSASLAINKRPEDIILVKQRKKELRVFKCQVVK